MKGLHLSTLSGIDNALVLAKGRHLDCFSFYFGNPREQHPYKLNTDSLEFFQSNDPGTAKIYARAGFTAQCSLERLRSELIAAENIRLDGYCIHLPSFSLDDPPILLIKNLKQLKLEGLNTKIVFGVRSSQRMIGELRKWLIQHYPYAFGICFNGCVHNAPTFTELVHITQPRDVCISTNVNIPVILETPKVRIGNFEELDML